MDKEIKIAARWWAEQLKSRCYHNAGDGMCNAMLAWGQGFQDKLPQNKIRAFEMALREEIKKWIGGNWYPDNPDKGSALRAIGVDYSPSGVFEKAADIAGINVSLRLPVKTMMWIDPHKVVVKYGYSGNERILYYEG